VTERVKVGDRGHRNSSPTLIIDSISRQNLQCGGAMHPCLTVPELIDYVFSHVATINISSKPCSLDWSCEDLKTLSALARTCKSFESIALDHLWHTQTDGLAPLLGVLLGDAVKQDPKPPQVRMLPAL
jgi:hypothetical protein